MPYISAKNDRREKLRNEEPALAAGELNYQIFYYVKHNNPFYSRKINKFITNFLGENPNYQRYNDLTGCLVRCYREIERRLGIKANMLLKILDSYDNEINKYEDKKIIENTDVE